MRHQSRMRVYIRERGMSDLVSETIIPICHGAEYGGDQSICVQKHVIPFCVRIINILYSVYGQQ